MDCVITGIGVGLLHGYMVIGPMVGYIRIYISALDRSAKMGSTHNEASIVAASEALPTDFLRKWSRSFVLSTNTPTDTAIMPKQRRTLGKIRVDGGVVVFC